MFQTSNNPCLASHSRVEDFQSDPPIQLAVVRRVNHAHAASTNLGFKIVSRSREIGNRRYFAQMVRTESGTRLKR